MEILGHDEFRSWTPAPVPSLIGDDILIDGGRLLIFGKPKSWKSMVAMHMAFCLALGRPFFGWPTKQCPVLYVQLEIPKAQFKKRYDKYCTGNKVPDKGVVMWTSTIGFLKLDSGYGYNELFNAIKSMPIKPKVVIVDPTYQLVTGNMSDAHDMSKLVSNIDMIRTHFGLTVVIIHHTRKGAMADDGTVINRGLEEVFGWGGFIWWIDGALGVDIVGDVRYSSTILVTPCALRHAEDVVPQREVWINRKDLTFKLMRTIKPDIGPEYIDSQTGELPTIRVDGTESEMDSQVIPPSHQLPEGIDNGQPIGYTGDVIGKEVLMS